MPTRPPRHGHVPTPIRKQRYDSLRDALDPARALYRSQAWRSIRANQLRMEPLCRTCFDQGDYREATVCDHVTPHRGDVQKFWAGPFQSLCASCHSSAKQRAENSDIPTVG